MNTESMISKMRNMITVFLLLTGMSFTYAEKLPMDTLIHHGVLDNGLNYYIMPNRQTPGQADFYLAIKVGSVVEKSHQKGLAHFLEHMAFNGTMNFPDGNEGDRSIRSWCEKKGIKFGADLNAYTSLDETVYNISNVPVSEQMVADTCLIILHDWASDMLLEDDEINNERGVIHEEWRARRSRFATTRMMEDAMPVIYKGTKYEDCMPIGHIELIDTFPPQALREYYKDWYRPDLQAVIVVGDVDVNAIEQRIKDLFGSLTVDNDAPERIYYPIPDNDEMLIYTQADREQPTINFSLYMKRDATSREQRDTRENYKEEYKSRLAMFILRQRMAQLSKEAVPRLMSGSVRDGAFYFTPEKDAFALTAGLLPTDPKAGIEAAIEIVEKARRYGFTESELEHAKIQNALRIEHKMESRNTTRNAEFAKAILSSFLNNTPLLNLIDEAVLVDNLNEELILDDINDAIKEIVTDTNQVAILFGPTEYNSEKYDLPSEEELRIWITAAQNRDYINDISDEHIDVNFIKNHPDRGSIIAKNDVDNGYTEYSLSNGINVCVRPSALETNRLTILMFREGGKSLFDKEDSNTLRFLNAVIKDSGASDFDLLTLEKKRKGKALRVIPYIDAEEEGVKGVCAASDLKTWLEIMYLYLTEPRKDKDIFDSLINRQRSMLGNRDANPNVVYNDSLRNALYGEKEPVQPFTIDRLDEVDFDRMYEIYKERFANLAGMNLIITGDVREEKLDDLLCQYVASLPGDPDSVQTGVGSNLNTLRKGRYTNVFEKEMATPSANTNIVYWCEMPYTAGNDLLISMLSQILRSRYTDKVREEKGGTYGVKVEGQLWRHPEQAGSIDINFRCDPSNYNELIKIVDRELMDIAENGPSTEEINKVKEYERKNYDRAVLTNGWWEYVRYNVLRNGVDFNENYVEKVNSVSPDSFSDIAKRLLDGGNRIQVTMVPPEV